MLTGATPGLRVLMTVDSVGGVWRYAMTLARGLQRCGVQTIFCGFGPPPRPDQREEASGIGKLVWTDLPLDWTVESPEQLAGIPHTIAALAEAHGADLIHLNLPSQAAGLRTSRPIITVTHSCTVTWFRTVHGDDGPASWHWQKELNRDGFRRSSLVLAPSQSHACLTESCYNIGPVETVLNASAPPEPGADAPCRLDLVYAAGRWWDDGKNPGGLDEIARLSPWPVLALGATQGPQGQAVQLNHARTVGSLPHETVRVLAKCATIFVSPSRYEPFGLAALEAASGGAALVLSDIPTYRELWGDAALFASPDSPEDFALQIERLAGDEALRRTHSDRAQQRAVGFTPGRQARAMHRHYLQVTKNHKIEEVL